MHAAMMKPGTAARNRAAVDELGHDVRECRAAGKLPALANAMVTVVLRGQLAPLHSVVEFVGHEPLAPGGDGRRCRVPRRIMTCDPVDAGSTNSKWIPPPCTCRAAGIRTDFAPVYRPIRVVCRAGIATVTRGLQAYKGGSRPSQTVI